MSDLTRENEARYDRMARGYQAVTRLMSIGTIGRLYRAACDALQVPSGGSLVDVGCGPATLTPYLVRRFGSSVSIFGADVSGEMVDLARRKAARRGWTKVEFERAPALEYEPPGPVDAVVFCLCLSGLAESERCVDRALSWLKPGGQIVVVDSILDPRRRFASYVIRAKASHVGAVPESFPLEHLRERLEDVSMRQMNGGVYSLLTGRRPSPQAGGQP